jgi:hypothetical protein
MCHHFKIINACNSTFHYKSIQWYDKYHMLGIHIRKVCICNHKCHHITHFPFMEDQSVQLPTLQIKALLPKCTWKKWSFTMNNSLSCLEKIYIRCKLNYVRSVHKPFHVSILVKAWNYWYLGHQNARPQTHNTFACKAHIYFPLLPMLLTSTKLN